MSQTVREIATRITTKQYFELSEVLALAAHVLASPTEAVTEEGPLTAQCNDCGHWQHSGPCMGIVIYDRPGGVPGNQQCLCKHVAISYTATTNATSDAAEDIIAAHVEAQERTIADLRAKASPEALGEITACPDCDGSGKNAHGDCCRIHGHARECQCALCQWKNACYRNENEANSLRAQLQAAGQERDEMRESVCGEAQIVGYYGDDLDSALTCFRSAISQAGPRILAAEEKAEALQQLADGRGREVERMRAALGPFAGQSGHFQDIPTYRVEIKVTIGDLQRVDTALAAPVEPLAQENSNA